MHLLPFERHNVAWRYLEADQGRVERSIPMKVSMRKHIAKAIGETVSRSHEGQTGRRWRPDCGQALVYGLELAVGFAESVCLESVAETAWRGGKCVETEVLAYLNKEYGNET